MTSGLTMSTRMGSLVTGSPNQNQLIDEGEARSTIKVGRTGSDGMNKRKIEKQTSTLGDDFDPTRRFPAPRTRGKLPLDCSLVDSTTLLTRK